MLRTFIVVTLFYLLNWNTAFAVEVKNDTQTLKQLAVSVTAGVNARDGSLVLQSFARPSALIFGTVEGNPFGKFTEASNTAKGLADFVDSFDGQVEQYFDDVTVEVLSPGHAIVTTKYRALINGNGSHQGEEYYTAAMTSEGWKFISLMFTMRPYQKTPKVEGDK